ncbi:MAG TPA: folylpolyglutamate synthase/dihydrofolate synthase family protein [Chitinophagales bacterium]|nr:folylpolyglutamate synthase/dihydrofolate synthase family protein [Chitinophagales bacterium]
MNYQETLDYLYNKLPMFSRIGEKAIKKDLTNTLLLCDFLDNPQHRFKSIHIAGTNGKGSVSHILASVLQEQGYKVGLYTSPHLKDFRERIKINGELCSEEFVIDFTEKIQSKIDEIEPSFFEITVAMAFDYFAQQQVDFAIIETGLGGRLDSTNVITPIISIVTNISYDHQHLLGNTLTEIATEKAGIIKTKIPVVIGKKDTETENVFIHKAKLENAPIFFTDEIYQFKSIINNGLSTSYQYINKITTTDFIIDSDLRANYQQENILTAFLAIEILNTKCNVKIDLKNEKQGFLNVVKNTNFIGRWQQLQSQPTIIADVGHNEAGVQKIIEQLQTENYNKLHIIYGAVKDKDIHSILALLPKKAIYYFTEPPLPRKLEVELLIEMANEHQLVGDKFAHPTLALTAAIEAASVDDLILITGSFFVVSEVL